MNRNGSILVTVSEYFDPKILRSNNAGANIACCTILYVLIKVAQIYPYTDIVKICAMSEANSIPPSNQN